MTATTVSANVNNFHISDFRVEYVLDRDDEGRSTLQVTESITAEFPGFDQNKGLVREIPVVYDDRPVGFELRSVTRNGAREPIYNDYRSGDMRVLETGTDDYVRGQQVYELRYDLRDVTRYFDDVGRDEFYWDVNGTGWRVPIDRVSARLTLGEALSERLTGDMACYQGAYGSNERCDITRDDQAIVASADQLRPGEGVTIAVGFESETFAAYQSSRWEQILQWWQRSLLVTIPAGIIATIWLVVMGYRWTYRSSELGTIVPEYLPPKDASVTVASEVLGQGQRVMVAQLIDLAVRRMIRIHETSPKSVWRPAGYDIEITGDASQLRVEERELLTDLFYAEPHRIVRGLQQLGRRPGMFTRINPDELTQLPLAIGERLSLKSLRNNVTVSSNLRNNPEQLRKLVRSDYGLRTQNPQRTTWVRRTGVLLYLAGILTAGPTILLAGFVALIMSHMLWPLSDKGLRLRRHLMGLRQYIGVAEAERLRMLQSPEGAEKVGSLDPDDSSQLIKLYERNLPYAVLFGQERQWNQALGKFYEATQQQPDWYVGQTTFSAGAFSGMINNFSFAVSTTSASSSSSSGGSGGGGFSGGGGGGGGGGGR